MRKIKAKPSWSRPGKGSWGGSTAGCDTISGRGGHDGRSRWWRWRRASRLCTLCCCYRKAWGAKHAAAIGARSGPQYCTLLAGAINRHTFKTVIVVYRLHTRGEHCLISLSALCFWPADANKKRDAHPEHPAVEENHHKIKKRKSNYFKNWKHPNPEEEDAYQEVDDDDQFLEVDFDVKYREANEKNMSEAGRILTERSQHRISAVTGLTKRFEKNDFDKVPLSSPDQRACPEIWRYVPLPDCSTQVWLIRKLDWESGFQGWH